MTERRIDYDSPWKEAPDQHFPEFLEFFFPQAHADIDWSHDWESLEQELRQLLPAAEVGKRLADKLVKVRKKSGDDAYIHIEVHGRPEQDFENRVHTYHYRARDRYNRPPASMVVLGDEDPNWRPSRYVFEEWGCKEVFDFPTVKLLDYAGREQELAQHPNPFALLVLAHLQAQRTRQNDPARVQAKVELIKFLYQRGLDAEEMRHWYRYLDWLLPLPEEQEELVWQEIDRAQEEKRMPFITYAERVGFKKGKSEGLQEGLLQGIESILEVKFGAEAAALLPVLRQQTDPDVLATVLQSIKTASTIDEVRRLLPEAPAPG